MANEAAAEERRLKSDARTSSSRLARVRRVHSLSGLFPLGAYLCFHAWEHAPVRSGRDALFARLVQTQHAGLELVLVILPLLLHAALGLVLARQPDREGAYASPAFRRLQLTSGALAGAFIAYHLASVWLPRLCEPNPIGAAYDAMLDHTGRLSGLVIHLVGLAAVCAHFGQGLGVALGRLWPARMAPTRARALGIALGVLLWLAFVNELASYATYAPLL